MGIVEPMIAKVIITLDMGTNEFGFTNQWEASLYKGAIPGQETEGRFTEWKPAVNGVVTFDLPEEVRENLEAPFGVPNDTYVRIRTLQNNIYPTFDLVTEPFTLEVNETYFIPVIAFSRATILPLIL